MAVRRALRRAAEGRRPLAGEPAARAARGAGLAARPAAAADRLGPARGRGLRAAGLPDRRSAAAWTAGRGCCSSARPPHELLGRVPGLQDLAHRRPGRARAAAGRRAGGDERDRRRARREHLLRHERGRGQEPQGGARGAAARCAAGLRHGLRDPARRATRSPARAGASRSCARTPRTPPSASHASSAPPAASGPRPGSSARRAFVKVQDGCTFGCSFCVIPRVRGASRSRPLRAVLDEARRRIAQGHRELVVTGVNLGLYRDADARAALPDVLGALAELDGVARVRLSSIEVNHLSQRLCEALAHPRVCPHLHVPLQSGDDAVLQAMRRRYDLATYARRIARAREHVPGLNLTGDVIVGFPAEDGAAFARTLTAVEELAFSRLHVFPYSPRPGTRTAGGRSGAGRGQAAAGRASARALRPARARAPRGPRRAARPRADRAGGRGWAPPRLRCGLHRVRAARARRRRDRRSRRGRARGPGRAGCSWGGWRDRSHRQGRQDGHEVGRRHSPRRPAPRAVVAARCREGGAAPAGRRGGADGAAPRAQAPPRGGQGVRRRRSRRPRGGREVRGRADRGLPARTALRRAISR